MKALLVLVYMIQIIFSILSSIPLLIVIHLLQRFDVFHFNLRNLISNALICIFINNCLQALRIILPLSQALMITANDEMNIICPQFNALPANFCAFLCINGLLICMERLYATFNFTKYENENFELLLRRLFVILWTLMALYSIYKFWVDVLPGINYSTYLNCQLESMRVNPLKTQWHLLFTLLFFSVFFLVHCIVLNVNKEKQEVYIKLYYSSLSHRFQIAENVKCVRLLLKLVPQIVIGIATLLAHAVWIYTKDIQHGKMLNYEQNYSLLTFNELNLLIMPIISSTIAFTIIRSSNVYSNKTRLIANKLCTKTLCAE
ncbi:hypothetical protein ACQ4LE_003625 [Meloidogyne hapla]